MKLIDDLRSGLSHEQSMFRAQLMREDIRRLEKLVVLAQTHQDLDLFKKEGMYLGWTRDDMRTHELKEPLSHVIDLIWACEKSGGGKPEADLQKAWSAFNAVRMKVLVHCL